MTEPRNRKTRDTRKVVSNEGNRPMNIHDAHTKQFLALNEKSPAMALVLGLARSKLFVGFITGVTLMVAGTPQKAVLAVKSEVAAHIGK